MLLYTALTANGSLSASGIKNLKVFYDTLLLNFKVENYEYLIIENINFDYEENTITALDNSSLIQFGNTNRYEADKTTGNGYIDTVLLEKEKILLVCGLSAYQPLSQTINGQTHTGSAIAPIVYEYNINTHTLHNIYPSDVLWESHLLGNVNKYKDAAVSFNPETNILNYIIKATRTVNSSAFFFWTDIELKYSQNKLTLSNMRCLTSLAINDVDIVSFRNYNDSEKIITTVDGAKLISFNI